MSQASDRAVALADRGHIAEAVNILSAASKSGDPDADFQLGLWLLSGQYLVRKLAVAREAFAKAAAAGHEQAGAIYIAFVANGTGGPPDWQEALRLLRFAAANDPVCARQMVLIDAMDLGSDGNARACPPATQPYSTDRINVVRGLFSADECRYLIDMATPLMAPSVVIDPRSGTAVRDPVRISDVAGFPLALEDPAIHALNKRIAVISNTEAGQGEPLQVLRYRQGQQFRPHIDALPMEANQRVQTVLVALNDEYDSGETDFLDLGVRWKGKQGDALIFSNVAPNGQPDPSMRHAGLEPASGEKFLASRWIRAKPLDLGDNV